MSARACLHHCSKIMSYSLAMSHCERCAVQYFQGSGEFYEKNKKAVELPTSVSCKVQYRYLFIKAQATRGSIYIIFLYVLTNCTSIKVTDSGSPQYILKHQIILIMCK